MENGTSSILHHWRNVLERIFSRENKEGEKNLCIPLADFKKAWGFGVVSIFKGGAIVTAEVGKGLFFIKLSQYSQSCADNKWIGPIFFNLYGSEIGFNIGATKADSCFIFSDEESVRYFLRKGQFQFGAAIGAVGNNEYSRTVEFTQPTHEVIKCYLLESKGIFIGASLQGCVLKIDYQEIEKFFGTQCNGDDFLSGRVQVPKYSDTEQIISMFDQYASENQNLSSHDNNTSNSKNVEEKISPQSKTNTNPAPIEEVRQKEIINACPPTSPSNPSVPYEPHHECGPTLHGSGIQLQQWQMNEAEKSRDNDNHNDLQQWQDNSANESKDWMAYQQHAKQVALDEFEIAKILAEKTEDEYKQYWEKNKIPINDKSIMDAPEENFQTTPRVMINGNANQDR